MNRIFRYLPISILGVLYLVTLSPYALGGDSAEFIAASVSMGICHPTGYALYVLLGKIFSSLLFFVPAEISINLLSTVYFVCCLIVFQKALNLIKISLTNQMLAVSLLGVTPSLWWYTRTAEVYTLQGLLFITIYYFIISWYCHRLFYKLLVAAFVAGLTLGNHETIVLIYPALFGLLVVEATRKNIQPHHVALILVAGCTGSLILLSYFILDRSCTVNYLTQYFYEFPDPQVTTSVARFFWLISGEQYSAVKGMHSLFSFSLWTDIWGVVKQLYDDNFLLILLGSLGLISCSAAQVLDSGSSVSNLLLRLTTLLTILYYSTYKYFEPVFFIGGYIICGIGTAQLLEKWFTNKYCFRCLNALLVVYLTVSAANQVRNNYGESGALQKRTADFLHHIENNAFVISGWKNSTMIWFHQCVEAIEELKMTSFRSVARW